MSSAKGWKREDRSGWFSAGPLSEPLVTRPDGGSGVGRCASSRAAAAHAEHQVPVDGLRLLDPFHEAVFIRLMALSRLAGADDHRGNAVECRHEGGRIGEVGGPGWFRGRPGPLL
jgi:hypothetical protein